MCQDLETSRNTYIIGSITSLYLLLKGDKFDKHIGIFSLVFIQMQLVEYFMWLDQDCGMINNNATIIGHLLIFLQPVIILIFGIVYETLIIPDLLLLILLIIPIYALVKFIILYYNKPSKYCSKEEKTGFLEWNFINGTVENSPNYLKYYTSILLFTWLFMKNKKKGFISFMIILSTLLYSNFDINNFNLSFKQWESRWCYTGTIFPLVFVALKFLKL